VAVADGFLALRLRVNLINGQIDFNQFFGTRNFDFI